MPKRLTPRSGRRTTQVRISAHAAAFELGVDPKTLQSRLKSSGTTPGSDGLYSISQIFRALTGDIDAARVRKEHALADRYELQAGQLRQDLVPVDGVLRVWSNIIVSIRQVIRGSHLSPSEQESLFRELRSINVDDITHDMAGADSGDEAE